MDRRIILAVIMFGSLWGLLESTLGAFLHLTHLPAGAVMASVALSLMAYTRRVYGVRGMQVSMAAVASLFKLLNLGFIGGCVWCPIYAIIAEGLLFELMLFQPYVAGVYSKKPFFWGASMGYLIYVGGYFATEIATPLFSSAGFYLSDLAAITSLILSRGLYAAFFSALFLPLSFRLSFFDISKLKSTVYYPLTSSLTLLFWFVAFIV